MPHNVVRDPEIRYGHFRVLARTDGTFVVVNERLPPGERTVMVFKRLVDADVSAKAWFEQGQGLV